MQFHQRIRALIKKMAAKRFNFTKKDIDALPAPTKSVRAY
jgi:hypothetical protein